MVARHHRAADAILDLADDAGRSQRRTGDEKRLGVLARRRDSRFHQRGAGDTSHIAIVVETEEAYLHCAKAFIRSKLWDPPSWPERDGLASPARIWKDHMAMAEMTEADIQAYVDDDYANNLRWGDR